MSYELKFGKRARRQWNDLDTAVRLQFAKKLEKVVKNPHVPSARLHGYENSYRIKLRKAGFRLGYRVYDAEIVVLVIAVGRRDKDRIYDDFDLYYNEGEE